MGSDFNSTLDHVLDRNYEEPHPQSAEALKSVTDHFILVDLWQNAFHGVRQYTWLRTSATQVSGARLDNRSMFCFPNLFS